MKKSNNISRKKIPGLQTTDAISLIWHGSKSLYHVAYFYLGLGHKFRLFLEAVLCNQVTLGGPPNCQAPKSNPYFLLSVAFMVTPISVYLRI